MIRSATSWHVTTDAYGRTIRYITSDEIGVPSAAVGSIYDPTSDEPSYRLFPATGRRVAMTEADEPFPATGLVVLGSYKGNRPTLDECEALTGLHGAAAAAAVRKVRIR